MRVLWSLIAMPNLVEDELKMTKNVFGGWVNSALETLSAYDELTIGVLFPQTFSTELIRGETRGVRFYGFPIGGNVESDIRDAVNDFQPEILHLWGTENRYHLNAVETFGNPARTLCSIQGICSEIAEQYTVGLDEKVIHGWTFRDWMRKDNIAAQKERFFERGITEKKILDRVNWVAGRTAWDRAVLRELAPHITYRHCNETLRKTFYGYAAQWDSGKTEKHSIFVSQAGYPIKGLHILIEALPKVAERYPDVAVYIAGENILMVPFYRIGSYHRYLRKRMKALKIDDRIHWLGHQSESEMAERYLKSDLYVLPSTIENSSNSLGEAMLIGVPVVASKTGGNPDFIQDGFNGFLYETTSPEALADKICHCFSNPDKMPSMSANAVSSIRPKYDKQVFEREIFSIYTEILSNESDKK